MSAFSNNTTQASGSVELYPSEVALCKEIITTMNRKFGGRPNTKQELVALAEETERRFKDIGLNVIVDISNIEMNDQNFSYSSPVVEITGRITPESTDHERMQYEIQHGYADKVEGVVDVNTGQLKDLPKKTSLWVPGSKN